MLTRRDVKGIFGMLICFGILILLPCAAISLSSAWVTDSLSDYGVSRQSTNQVRIHETEETKRIRIQWDSLIEIAKIDSNALQRTSGWALGHRAFDLAIVVGLLGAIVVGLLLLVRRIERGY